MKNHDLGFYTLLGYILQDELQDGYEFRHDYSNFMFIGPIGKPCDITFSVEFKDSESRREFFDSVYKQWTELGFDVNPNEYSEEINCIHIYIHHDLNKVNKLLGIVKKLKYLVK